MTSNIIKIDNQLQSNEKVNKEIEFLTLSVGKQQFGIAVNNIRDVIIPTEITTVPMVTREVIGLINLRGRIVTAVDIREILDIDSTYNLDTSMSVVVDFRGDLYSLIVDKVGEVVTTNLSNIEENPEHLEEKWLEIAIGIYTANQDLIVLIDIAKLIKKLGEKNK